MALKGVCLLLLSLLLTTICLGSGGNDVVDGGEPRKGNKVEIIKPSKSDISPPLRTIKPRKSRNALVPHEKPLHLNPNRNKHRTQ